MLAGCLESQSWPRSLYRVGGVAVVSSFGLMRFGMGFFNVGLK